jgi:putative ABC transport system permease protein
MPIQLALNKLIGDLMISALNRKLLRDVWNIKGQMSAIVMVMAAGIAVFIIMFGVLDSLKLTRDTYYDRYQFADVFVSLKRAPNSVRTRINDIPGVSIAEKRVVFGLTLQMPNMSEPVSGKVISLPDGSTSLLNKLYLRSGRLLEPNEENAVLADESFVNAHQLELGDSISAIMNGHRRQLKIVGVVLSPEYVYSIAPGALMPDGKRYGLFWMSQRSLEAAVNMKGAFNDIAIKVQRNANIEDIKEQLDNILKPYGGLIAYARDEQISNFFLENELKQLSGMGSLAPVIFLSVAAFLINVVMSRQIATQREQIGMLKAVGYSNWEVSLLYIKMVLVVTFVGSTLGLSLGAWMGSGMTSMYTEFFHFPILKYHFSVEVMIFAVLSCVVAALLGTLVSIRAAVNLPPADAMRPESPAVFKPTFVEKMGLHQHLSFLSRIVLRQLERRPFRAILSSLGIALSLAILIFSFFMQDAMDYMLDVQYDLIQREDLSLTFVEPKDYRALEEIKAMPGVLRVEPIRQVPVYFKSKHFKKRGSITGLAKEANLRQAVNQQLKPINMPQQGLIMSQTLADILHLKAGDRVDANVLDEKRQNLQITVTAITQEFIGMGVYMDIRQLNHILDSGDKVTAAAVAVDPKSSAAL